MFQIGCRFSLDAENTRTEKCVAALGNVEMSNSTSMVQRANFSSVSGDLMHPFQNKFSTSTSESAWRGPVRGIDLGKVITAASDRPLQPYLDPLDSQSGFTWIDMSNSAENSTV